MPPDLIVALPPPAGAAPPGSPTLTGTPAGAALFASLLAGAVPPPPALVPSPTASSPAAAPLTFAVTGTAKSSVAPSLLGIAATGTEAAPAETAASAPRKLVAGNVPPPLLLLSTALPQAALLSAIPSEEDSVLKDTQKEDTKEPVDIPSAPVPTGELLLPPPPPLLSAVLPALPAATPPAALPSPDAPAAPRIPEAVLARPEPMVASMPPAAPAPAPVSWTPPTDTPVAVPPTAAVLAAAVPVANTAVATPGFALPTGTVQVTPAPDKNSAQKTPQKDLKTTGARADTYTRTQTELPRLDRLSRTELRTEATPTDGHPMDGTPTEEPRTDERRTDAGQGPAALPAATPLLSTGSAAAAVPESKVTEIKTLTHTEKLAIVQQLADGAGGMRLSAPGAAQEMTVQLHPKDWGSLHITVQIAPTNPVPGDALKDNLPKTVTAQIVAETPQVKAALESHSGDLHQKLREAGLHLDSVTVTVRAPEGASKSSGTTPQGGQTNTQGRFQEGAQGSLNGSTSGSIQSQGGTQGSDFGQRLTDFSGRQDGNPAPSGGGASSSQNNPQSSSQGGRQGGQTPHETRRWMGTEPDVETVPRWAARASSPTRLDLRA